MTKEQVINELKRVENVDELAKLYYGGLKAKAGVSASNKLHKILDNKKLKLGENDRLVTHIIEGELNKAKGATTQDEALEHLKYISTITKGLKYSKYVLINEDTVYMDTKLNYNSEDEFPKLMAQIIKAYKYME